MIFRLVEAKDDQVENKTTAKEFQDMFIDVLNTSDYPLEDELNKTVETISDDTRIPKGFEVKTVSTVKNPKKLAMVITVKLPQGENETDFRSGKSYEYFGKESKLIVALEKLIHRYWAKFVKENKDAYNMTKNDLGTEFLFLVDEAIPFEKGERGKLEVICRIFGTKFISGIIRKAKGDKSLSTTRHFLEVVPIIIGYKLASMPITASLYKQLGIDKKEFEEAKKEADSHIKNKGNPTDYYKQGLKISEIILANPDFDVHRGDDLFIKVKNTGREILAKDYDVRELLYVKEQEIKQLSRDKYTPADFIMVRKDKKNFSTTNFSLSSFNNKFANNLLIGDKIQSVSKGINDFWFIGVSQKISQIAQAGGAGEFFSKVHQFDLKNEFKELVGKENNSERLREILKKLYKKINTTIREKCPFIKIEFMAEDMNIKDLTKHEYITSERVQAPDALKTKIKILLNVEKIISEIEIGGSIYDARDHLLALAQFALCGKKTINPCFYKLTSDHIEPFNTAQFRIRYNNDEKAQIIYPRADSDNVTIMVPIIIQIDIGEDEKKEYKSVNVPFRIQSTNIQIQSNLKDAKILDKYKNTWFDYQLLMLAKMYAIQKNGYDLKKINRDIKNCSSYEDFKKEFRKQYFAEIFPFYKQCILEYGLDKENIELALVKSNILEDQIRAIKEFDTKYFNFYTDVNLDQKNKKPEDGKFSLTPRKKLSPKREIRSSRYSDLLAPLPPIFKINEILKKVE